MLFICARPVGDSDLWYNLAYARQMVASGSLILDHTLFSWTPADNAVIYCAWISQLGLYGLHQIGGLTALFVFRYVLFLSVLGVVAAYARHGGVLSHPVTWFVTVVALLMSSAAVTIKPNITSYLLMSVTVALWHWVRRRGEPAWAWAYTLPLVMLVWVNSHGGFVMGLAFLFLAALGEFANVRLSPAAAVTPVLRRHLLTAVGLCFVAVMATPYGWRYPLQFFIVDLPAIDLAAVREYDSIFAPSQRGLRYVEYGALMAMLLVTLLAERVRRRDVEWGLVLTNLGFAGLYIYYARLTAFWAPVALISAVTLMADRPAWLHSGGRRGLWRGSAWLVAAAALSAHAIRADAAAPPVGTWQGFGNSYWNPEEEADYISGHFAGKRLGNDYNAGGYLIWKLWPGTRVFIDARYFPYRSWFQEYLDLETIGGIDALLRKYPAEVWCVEHVLPRTVAWFRSSPDWVPAFYGSSAVVFVRRGTALPEGRLQAGARLGEIQNLYQALLVLAFAFDVRDVAGAERVVSGMERRFRSARERPVVARARTALDGVLAYQRGDYPNAMRLLAGAEPAYTGAPAQALIESAMLETRRLWLADDVPRALETARLAARLGPLVAIARYNAGVIGWWIEQRTTGSRDESWRRDLEAFLALSVGSDPALADAAGIARALLAGQVRGRPPVLAPTLPRLGG